MTGQGEVVALEALARVPKGSPFESLLVLFGQAQLAGRVAELDWVCRAAAFRAVLAAGIPPAMSLFVNVEAEALAEECPAHRERRPVFGTAVPTEPAPGVRGISLHAEDPFVDQEAARPADHRSLNRRASATPRRRRRARTRGRG